MKKVFIWICCFVWCYALGITAQTVTPESLVRNVDESALFCNDTSVYVVKLKMDWPEHIGNNTMLSLQHYLTQFFFDEEGDKFLPALNLFTRTKGLPADSMPDFSDEHRYYIDCTLKLLWYAPDEWLTLYAYKQERNGEGRVLSSKRQYFTYDMKNDKVITQKDIFNQSRLWGIYDDDYRIVFEELVEHFAQVGEHDYIDMSKVPQNVALYQNRLMIDLGESLTNVGRDNMSLIPLEHLTFLFTKDFKKRVKTKNRPTGE